MKRVNTIPVIFIYLEMYFLSVNQPCTFVIFLDQKSAYQPKVLSDLSHNVLRGWFVPYGQIVGSLLRTPSTAAFQLKKKSEQSCNFANFLILGNKLLVSESTMYL